MRIACVYLPQFPLQVALRNEPHLVNGPIAVVGSNGVAAPLVVSYSKAASALGVRIGMSPAVVRARNAFVVSMGEADLNEAANAVAESMLSLSASVDRGGTPSLSLAVYAEVPTGCRGIAFGKRIREQLEQAGWRARVGIADDRFTAWVAASRSNDESPVVSVPRGCASGFLAPLPLSLLSISPEVQHVLGALGVTTLGQFAALPPPSVARVWDADYQALARGDGPTTLYRFSPAPIAREAVEVHPESPVRPWGLVAAVETLAARIRPRLDARRNIYPSTELVLRIFGEPGEDPVTAVVPWVSGDDNWVENGVTALLREHQAALATANYAAKGTAEGAGRGPIRRLELVLRPPAAVPSAAKVASPATKPVDSTSVSDAEAFALISPETRSLVSAPAVATRRAPLRTRRGKQRPHIRYAQARLL